MSSDLERRFWRRFSVRTTLGFVLLLAAAVVVAFLLFRYGLHRSLERELDEVLEGDVRELVYHLASPKWLESLLKEELGHEVAGRSEHGLFFRLYEASGDVRWTIPPSESVGYLPPPEALQQVLQGHRQHLRHPQGGHPDALSVLYPVPQPDGSWRACQVGVSTGQIRERLAKYTYVFGGVGAAIVAVGAVAVHLLLRLPLGRLRAILGEVRTITASALDRRLALSGAGDEFDDLSRTLNDMLRRLEVSVQGLERFAGDAAHELRGPVARLRMAAETALHGNTSRDECAAALADVADQADRLADLIEDLLFLVLQDGGASAGRMEDLDAAALLAETLSLYEGVAEERGVTLALAAPDPACVRGHRQHLLRALGNLAENAVRLTEAGGRVDLGGRADATAYHFSVRDTGCGIAPAHLPRVFERFYRTDAARSDQGGTGLGLSIVSAIAKAHGGDVTVKSEPGKGSLFTLTIPRSF